MNKPPSPPPPPPANPRGRLQQLLAIPERDRTEEQWDEMNELEIMLAAGNRRVEQASRQGQQHRSNPPTDPGIRPNQGGGGGPDNRKPGGGGRKFHKRPPRRKP